MRPLPLMATLTAAASLSPKPRVLGVTGGIAMGKSTITKLLQTVYRIPFHDADQCVRRLYSKGGPAVAPVAAAFGADVVSDGAVDRASASDMAAPWPRLSPSRYFTTRSVLLETQA